MKRIALLVLLVLCLTGVLAATPEPASAAAMAASAYWCPPYTIYCQRASQCDSYCGGAGWGACEFGCCACLA